MQGIGSQRMAQADYCEDFQGYGNEAEDFDLRFTGGAGATFHRMLHPNGVVRIAMTAAQTADGILASGAVILPEYGGVSSIEQRILVTDVSVASVFVGLSDSDTEAGGTIIENEDGVLNTVPADAIGFLLEGEQDLNWGTVGVKNNADIPWQKVNHEYAESKDNQWRSFGLNVGPNGTVDFFIDGRFMRSIKEAIRPNVLYVPVLGTGGRGTAYRVDYDYILRGTPRSNAVSNTAGT